MKSYLIPLGIRCNAAMITKAIVDQPRFPFDWAQMNVESMRDVIHLEKENIKEFWTKYFSSIDDTFHTSTGSWFPHDNFSIEEIESTIQKYIRRTERLQKVLNSSEHVTYVIMFGFPEKDCISKVLELTFAIKALQQGSCSFIVCNAWKQETEREDCTFIFEELYEIQGSDSWENLTQRLVKRVKNHLDSNNIDVIPFIGD